MDKVQGTRDKNDMNLHETMLFENLAGVYKAQGAGAKVKNHSQHKFQDSVEFNANMFIHLA